VRPGAGRHSRQFLVRLTHPEIGPDANLGPCELLRSRRPRGRRTTRRRAAGGLGRARRGPFLGAQRGCEPPLGVGCRRRAERRILTGATRAAGRQREQTIFRHASLRHVARKGSAHSCMYRVHGLLRSRRARGRRTTRRAAGGPGRARRGPFCAQRDGVGGRVPEPCGFPSQVEQGNCTIDWK